MSRYLLFAILFFHSSLAFTQESAPEKASLFTAVKWEKDLPIVQFENQWYYFEKIDDIGKERLLDFCKENYGAKWQKRFSEDLVEVLKGLSHQPGAKVALQLSKNGVLSTYTGTFTTENRQKLILYNKSLTEPGSASTFERKIPAADAIADLKQFQDILESVSAYSRLSGFDYKQAIEKLAYSIAHESDGLGINAFTNQIALVISEIGDRHASVKNETIDKKVQDGYNLRLPFGLATLNGKIIAVKKKQSNGNYRYYHHAYPNIKSINGKAIEMLVDTFNYRDQKAPKPARLSRGSNAIQKYGALMAQNNIKCPDRVKVIFTNGVKEKTETLMLTSANHDYSSKLQQEHNLNRIRIGKKDFNGLSSILAHNIGYINIPEMYTYQEIEGLEGFIKKTFAHLANTKALIIDIRNNPGGSREILQTFAQYMIQAEQSPWVANVAYLRTDKKIVGDEKSMADRYLYSYKSGQLTEADRKAIDHFLVGFKLSETIDTSKFSNPFYMVLNHGQQPYTQPIYILTNEESFSAASVFASAFKGLPNVKIVGQTTDGSSGNSRILHLKNSNISINISTMLSFQRNGTTLDGNGTVPDLIIRADQKQALKGYDSQLNKLVNIINKSQ